MPSRRGALEAKFLAIILLAGVIPAALVVVLTVFGGGYLFRRTMGRTLEARALEVAADLDRRCERAAEGLRERFRAAGGGWEGAVAAARGGEVAAVVECDGDAIREWTDPAGFPAAEPTAWIRAICRRAVPEAAKGGVSSYIDDALLPPAPGREGSGFFVQVERAEGGRAYVFLHRVEAMIARLGATPGEQPGVVVYSRRGYALGGAPAEGLLDMASERLALAPKALSGVFARPASGSEPERLVGWAVARGFRRLAAEGRSGTEWVVLIPYDMEDFRAPHAALVWFSVSAALVWCLLLTAIAAYSANRIAGPIVDLQSQAEAIAAGDFARRAATRTGDEIEDLAAAFNRMAETVGERDERIRRFNLDLERRIEERTRELEVANRRLMQTEKYAATGRLAANLAHEINNPLGIIKNYLLLARKQLAAAGGGRRATDPNIERLDVIEEEIDRIARIVRRLLDLHRPAPREVKETDLDEILDEILGLMEEAFAKEGIRVVRERGEPLPRLVLDPDLMKQVFLNLLRNAQDAMEERGGELRVRTGVRDEEAGGSRSGEGGGVGGGESGKVVFVSIEDTGCGIPSEDLGRIFDPFFTTKPSDRGTGLGLAVSYGIARSYGGSIEASSRAGEGTRMTVTIPVPGPGGEGG